MENIYVDFNSIKNEKLKELEVLSCDEVIKKIKELSLIVDSIEQHWHGSKADLYRKRISDIMDAINDFKTNCLEKNITDIQTQVQQYENNEETE